MLAVTPVRYLKKLIHFWRTVNYLSWYTPSLSGALEEVQKIKPKGTLFTGMMHLMDHEKVNECTL
ncbi:hypothetical protein SLEP1_g13472 [Rubroshorea leprosula]|uniref:Uncharacterized protein n=1 Tax=Rubroshorea leprosula TaxID=152421 RepID=A0AAV5IG12_9ROSI|nr:hypothetical protein SLEP1_g13472 [Rubroshorea leprosula]